MQYKEIVDISNKKQATREVREYFLSYPNIPETAVACPGGLCRSEMFTFFLIRNKLALCPLNTNFSDNKLYFNGISFIELKNQLPLKRIDVVVLCSDLESDYDLIKITEISKEIDYRIPVLLIKGMEGNFSYFCQ